MGIVTTTDCTSFVTVASSDTSGGGGAAAREYAVDFDGNAFALGESVWTVSQPINKSDTATGMASREIKTTARVEFESFALRALVSIFLAVF